MRGYNEKCQQGVGGKAKKVIETSKREKKGVEREKNGRFLSTQRGACEVFCPVRLVPKKGGVTSGCTLYFLFSLFFLFTYMHTLS